MPASLDCLAMAQFVGSKRRGAAVAPRKEPQGPVAQFGSLLKAYREQAGHTQEELATLARISVRGLRYLERAATSPNPRTVRRLASALSLTPAQQASLVAAAREARTLRAASIVEPDANRVAEKGTAPGGVRDMPGQLTNFIGREATLTMASRRLADDRLVTLVGPGGCGKTRIAIEVGRLVRAARPDGVFFADLSGLSDPVLVPGALLRALGLREVPGRDATDVLISLVTGRDLLVVLDNCEHLVEACAVVAQALIGNCPRAWLLSTSREPLRNPRRESYCRRRSRGAGPSLPGWGALAREFRGWEPFRRPGAESEP